MGQMHRDHARKEAKRLQAKHALGLDPGDTGSRKENAPSEKPWRAERLSAGC
jgi:hypothetical protein